METIRVTTAAESIHARSPAVRYFCTYFDHRYLSRGLSLYESLKRCSPSFQLWILCLDDLSHTVLADLQLPEVRLLTLAMLELDDPALKVAKANRPVVEYYFTCTPSLPLFILHRHAEVDLLAYLDADLYFFSSPEPLFAEMGDGSVAIIEHRWPPAMQHMNAYGIFNVGLVAFRRDERALTCLRWWRTRCLESCDTRTEQGRYGDQKYLDDWPRLFPGVVVLHHKGANAGVWNLANHEVTCSHTGPLLDGQPLVFFHFHGLKRLQPWLFDFHFSFHHVRPNDAIIRGIFSPYINSLLTIERHFRRELPVLSRATASSLNAGTPGLNRRITEMRSICAHLLRRNYGAVFLQRLVLPPWWLVAAYYRLRG